ncbi:hypothetical protein JXA02_05625 [candidate division KSB1 bacterium]|nr:hypothetical protein [candidate division KSB1 bacterium]
MARHAELVGGKAHNLARLARGGFHVPDFIVISTRAMARPLHGRNFFKKLRRAVQKHFPDIATVHVAARSSAPQEDHQRHSFAGLYQSSLNLPTVEAVCAAVQEVQRSLDRNGVLHYSRTFSAANNAMAVIIQKMIRPVVSGVIFTANPVDNDDNAMLVEIVDGSCAALVSGERAPVQVVIQKADHSYSIHFPAKKEASVLSFVTREENIDRLVKMATEIERLFGAPQDIEWSFDGAFWILQSRPISTLQHEKTSACIDEHGIRWSNYFFAERFVTQLSPLGWSFLQPIIRETALQAPLWYLGYDDLCRSVQLKLLRGIPYTQLDAYQKLYAHLPPSFISRDKKETLELPSERQRLSLHGYISILFRLLLADLAWLPSYNLWQWHTLQKMVLPRTRKMVESLENWNLAECYQALVESRRLSYRFLSIHRWSITFADIFSSLLIRFLRAIEVVDDGVLTNLLNAPDNETMKANKSLLRLDLADSRAVHRFLAEYGHRSESLDIARPTWAEEGQRIAEMSAMLKRSEKRFLDTLAANERLKRAAHTEIEQRLKQYNLLYQNILRTIFKVLLYYAYQFALLRENQRDMWQRILQVSRFAALRMSELLCAAGKLRQSDDIFYLQVSELQSLLVGEWRGDLALLIHARRRRQDAWAKTASEEHAVMHAAKEGARAYRGIGVSQGQARGYARIARNYAEAMQAQPGEILVVPCADPAWSPVFSVIAGLVMERGGILSHASIMAREFRLPTITGIGQATKKIQDGDLVEIDGKEGRLVIEGTRP